MRLISRPLPGMIVLEAEALGAAPVTGLAAAATLESSEQCRDAQWLMQMPVPPVESREVLRAVQAELLRAASFQAAGRNVEGLRLAEASLAGAPGGATPSALAKSTTPTSPTRTPPTRTRVRASPCPGRTRSTGSAIRP